VHLLEEIAIAVQEAKQKHDLLILGMNEAVLSALRAHPRANALKNRQGRSVESLTEYAFATGNKNLESFLGTS
jgi:hypothetical protein